MTDPVPVPVAERSQARRFVALIVIGAATAQVLGLTLRMPTQLTANDISRWCTVWSLLERGTYAIDDCPWQANTQDKVRREVGVEAAGKEGEASKPVFHVYSSKPPLLPTVIAGILYPFRAATGVPLDKVVDQVRVGRNVEKPLKDNPNKTEFVREVGPPVPWPAYVFYFKPIVVLFNVVPFALFLVYYARLLDRFAANDWAWFLSLFAAAFGNLLVVFNTTLNNHTIAAYAAFFAILPLARIWDEDGGRPVDYALAGFFGALCAVNELPSALFGVLLFALLAIRSPMLSLKFFTPAALIPIVAHLATQYLALGTFRPAYEDWGTAAYNYEGSYWNDPLEFDWFTKHPESKALYLFHMTLGHHGVFSLTPIFAFAFIAGIRNAFGKGRPLRVVSAVTVFLTVAMLAFYTWNPKARNYGGSTQGLRWLFWLIPFWLVTLPTGLAEGQERAWPRRLSLAALSFSVLSVGYAMRSPWSHPWILDLLEHLDLYHLVR
ncbi:hypothetical protein TA3x_003332 [Tundrisphaera sp. TA3]|uniref:hypothetical protein n=1 Tax=Tundrisphaera sp. TA3 TaxID=3435775 RepID=UPI003EB70478